MEYDNLTDLPTRSEFLRQHGMTKSGVIVLVDVDNMAMANSLLGHAVGDRALAEVSALMQASCPSAFIARFGGDEFVALFSAEDDDERVAVAAAHRIRAAAETQFAALRMQCQGVGSADSQDRACPLTLTLAVVNAGRYGHVAKGMQAASQAIGHGKTDGRNRVVIATSKLAGIDALTGLLNRRAFSTTFDQVRRAEIGGFGTIVLDLDRFKCINDARGYDFGDELLCAVGATLRHTKGLLGAARYGADEFAILLRTQRYGLDSTAKTIWQDLVLAASRFREQLLDVLAVERPTHLGPPRLPLGFSLAAIWVPPEAMFAERDVVEVAEDMLQAIRSLKGTGYMALRLPSPSAAVDMASSAE